MTYELVSGDYVGSQYTSARVARNDMLKGIGTRRARLIRQFCEPIKREFMFWAVTTGKLKFSAGDFKAMVKDPRMATPFVKSFAVMGKV